MLFVKGKWQLSSKRMCIQLTKKLQLLMVIDAIFALLSIVLMLLLAFITPEGSKQEALRNYSAIPFWISLFIGAILIAVSIWNDLVKQGNILRGQRLIFSLVSLGLIIFSALVLYAEVINPIRDIPDLENSSSVHLTDIRFHDSNFNGSSL